MGKVMSQVQIVRLFKKRRRCYCYGQGVMRSQNKTEMIMVSFHCCVAAWVSTSKSVYCQFGELCYWNIIQPPVGAFILTREERMILPRILTSLLKQHIAYRCALCARFANGIKKDMLIQLQHRISFKSLMYLVIRQQVSENQCTTFFLCRRNACE